MVPVREMLRQGQRAALSALLTLVAAGPAASSPIEEARPATAPSGWYEVRTEELVLSSNLDVQRTAGLAEDLRSFTAFLRFLVPGTGAGPGRRVHVYAFAARRDFRRYASPPRGVAGLFVATPVTDYVGVHAGSANGLQHVFHESVHQWLARNHPTCPTWLAEGLAYYLQTYRRSAGVREVGGRPPGLSPSSAISATELLGATAASPEYPTKRFAAGAWALTHWLLANDPRRIASLLARIDAGSDSARAIADVHGIPLEDLDRGLALHVRQSGLATSRLELPDTAVHGTALPVARPLGEAEVLARLGELSGVARGKADESAELFRRALEQDPENVRALVGVALLANRDGDRASASRLLRGAAAASPGDAIVAFARGEIALAEFSTWREGRPPGAALDLHPALVAAREAFDQARRLDPRLLAAHNNYAHTYLFDPETRRPGIAVCREVLAETRDLALAITLVRLLSDEGQRAAAHEARARFVLPFRETLGGHEPVGTPWSDVARKLTAADRQLAERLVEQGRREEARDVLEHALTTAPTDLRPALALRLDQLRQAAP